jgi:hypothetical protein
MQDPLSADDRYLKAWRANVESTITEDDEPVLSHATKLIIAVACRLHNPRLQGTSKPIEFATILLGGTD